MYVLSHLLGQVCVKCTHSVQVTAWLKAVMTEVVDNKQSTLHLKT